MIPSKLNPLGIDYNYPLMEFADVGGGIWEVEGQSTQEVRSVSANLFDKSRRNISKFVRGVDGDLFDSASSDSSDYIPINPNTNYTISGSVDGIDTALCWYDDSKNILSHVYSTNGVKTSPNNAKFARMTIRKTNVDTFQFELGTTATPYQPFVPGPSPQYPSPIISNYPKGVYKTPWGYIRLYDDLRGIGEYRDKITYNKATGEKVLTNNIGKVVLNGNEAYEYELQDVSFIEFRTFISDLKFSTPAILCDKFTRITGGNEKFDRWNNFLYFRLLKSRLNTLDVEGFKEWVSENNLIFEYALQSPINEYL